MKLDLKRKQVTLYDPSTVGHVSQTHRKMGVAAPKMFAFDSIFEADTTQVFFDFISRIAMYRSFIRKENRKPKIKIKKNTIYYLADVFRFGCAVCDIVLQLYAP